jgi:predicted amidophosphoribosyltransferase
MRTLADLLLPHPCPCGNPSGPICAACDRLLTGGARLVRPYPAPRGLPVCAAAASYGGAVRRLLIAYKERGRRDLTGGLALALARAVLALPIVVAAARSASAGLLLVPVPASRAAFRTRGVDHIVALACRCAAELQGCLGYPVSWDPLLEPTRRVADQAGLRAAERSGNVAGALRVRRGYGRAAARAAKTLVVVDDVLTSGATLAEAARALRAAGVRPAGAAVVATVVRRDPLGRPALSPWVDRD